MTESKAMKPLLPAAAALVAALATALPAAAETDLATAAKIVCVPDTVTRCDGPGRCTTRPATPGDKTEVLVIDFAAKTVSMLRNGTLHREGDVTEVTSEGGVRHIRMKVSGRGETAIMTLTRAGKLAIGMEANGNKAEATCTAS